MGRLREFGRDVNLFLLYNLFAFVGFGAFQVIYNLYLYQLGLRENFIGLFSAIQTLALAVGAIAMGTLLHRFGTWRCVSAGLGLFLVISAIQAFMEDPAVLLVLAGVSGLSQALLATSTMPCVIAWSKPLHRQHVAAVTYSVVALASTIGALLGGILPALLHHPFPDMRPDSVVAYRWTLVICTIIAAIAAAPLARMGEARQEPPAARRPAPAESEASDSSPQVHRDMHVWILIGGLMGLGAGMLLPFYNIYLTTLGADSQEVGYVFALGGLGSAAIGLGAPWLMRRQGALRAGFWLRLAAVPCFVLLLVMPVFAIAVGAYLIRVITINMAAPIESTFISELLPGRARTDVFGHRAGAWYVTSALTSIAGGAVIVRYGYSWPIVCLIVFTAIPEFVYLYYYRRQPSVLAGEIPSALPLPDRVAAVVAEIGPASPASPASPARRPGGQAARR